MRYVNVTKSTLCSVDELQRRDSELTRLQKELEAEGVWGEIEMEGKIVLLETIDLLGDTHGSVLIHGGFPVELVPPYIPSEDLIPAADGAVGFRVNPLVSGKGLVASLRKDVGGQERVGVIMEAMGRWEKKVRRWVEAEAEGLKAEIDRAEAREAREVRKVREKAERGAERKAAREKAREKARADKVERAERARWVAFWRALVAVMRLVARAERDAEEAREAQEKAEREARIAREFAERRAARKAEREAKREAARNPVLRAQGGEVGEITAEGWVVWRYPVGRYADEGVVERGERGEGGEGGEVAIQEIEADLPIILDVVRLHVSGDRRAWEDASGWWVVTGDRLSLHVLRDAELALWLLRAELRVKEAQEFRGEGYCRKVRRQDGWDARLEKAMAGGAS